MASPSLGPSYSPPQISRSLCVAPDKVRTWIAKGELAAVNVGNRQRPRWRVSQAALDAFLASRSAKAPAPTRSTRRRRTSPVVEEFI